MNKALLTVHYHENLSGILNPQNRGILNSEFRRAIVGAIKNAYDLRFGDVEVMWVPFTAGENTGDINLTVVLPVYDFPLSWLVTRITQEVTNTLSLAIMTSDVKLPSGKYGIHAYFAVGTYQPLTI